MSEHIRQLGENDRDYLNKRSATILEHLGLSWKDLSQKAVLDVGAGTGIMTVAASLHQDVNVSITGIENDPRRYSGKKKDFPEIEMWKNFPPKNDPQYVIADASSMPFTNESFDMVISHGAPPTISAGQEESTQVIKEIVRVLKPGGEARFYPSYLLFLALGTLPTDLKEREEYYVDSTKRSLKFLNDNYSELNPEIISNGLRDPMFPQQYIRLKKPQ